MIKRNAIWIFVFLLAVHLIHVIEEVLGKAYFIETIYNGLTGFLIINILLWIIPTILLIYVVKKRKIAYYFSMIYAGIMIIDGLDHVVRNYAGIYTGIVFIILGILLIVYLYKEMKEMKNMKGGKR